MEPRLSPNPAPSSTKKPSNSHEHIHRARESRPPSPSLALQHHILSPTLLRSPPSVPQAPVFELHTASNTPAKSPGAPPPDNSPSPAFPTSRHWNPSNVFSNTRFITYFVDHIPEDWDSTKLRTHISSVETAIDVYIPVKRSKGNTRFGFARFLKLHELEHRRLERLSSLSSTGHSLKFSISRFSARKNNLNMDRLVHKRTYPLPQTSSPNSPVPPKTNVHSLDGNRIDERSYAKVVHSGPSAKPFLKDTPTVHVKASIQTKEWLERSAVGTAKGGILRSGVIPDSIGVKSLGGDLFLLTFNSIECMSNELSSKKALWNSLFSDIHPWRPVDISNRRYCWIKISGLPLHAWNTEGFQSLVQPFGTLVQVHEKTAHWEYLQAALLLILTSSESTLEEKVTVSIEAHTFSVYLTEMSLDGGEKPMFKEKANLSLLPSHDSSQFQLSQTSSRARSVKINKAGSNSVLVAQDKEGQDIEAHSTASGPFPVDGLFNLEDLDAELSLHPVSLSRVPGHSNHFGPAILFPETLNLGLLPRPPPLPLKPILTHSGSSIPNPSPSPFSFQANTTEETEFGMVGLARASSGRKRKELTKLRFGRTPPRWLDSAQRSVKRMRKFKKFKPTGSLSFNYSITEEDPSSENVPADHILNRRETVRAEPSLLDSVVAAPGAVEEVDEVEAEVTLEVLDRVGLEFKKAREDVRIKVTQLLETEVEECGTAVVS